MSHRNCVEKRDNNEVLSCAGDIYEIQVEAPLESHWSTWFEDWSLIPQEDGTTIMIGLAPDQAALHGLLMKVRDLNLPLISVCRITPGLAKSL